MSKNNRVFVIFFSILLFLTVGMSEKAYAEQISGTVHNELVGTFDKSQTSNRTIEEVDCKINPNPNCKNNLPRRQSGYQTPKELFSAAAG